MISPRLVVPLSAAVLAIGLLSGCASDTADSDAQAPTTCPLTVTDPWVKATDTEMTGAFGIIENSGAVDVTVVSAASPRAGMTEIHEVVDKDGEVVMQPKDGGLVVPAGGSAELKPGGDHVMLMKLEGPIEAGDEVEITATCADGGSVTWTSVAKPFEGGAETYVPAEGGSMDGDMEGGAEPSASSES